MPKAQDPEIDIYFETAKEVAVFRARRNPRILRWLELVGPDPPESPTKPCRKRPRDTISDSGDSYSYSDNRRIPSLVKSPVAHVMSSEKRKRDKKARKTQPNSDVTGGEIDPHSDVKDGSDDNVAKKPRQIARKTLPVDRDRLPKLKKPVIKHGKILRANHIRTTLPTDLHGLYSRLNAVKSGRCIMPDEIREEIQPYLDDFFDFYFQEPVNDPTGNREHKAFTWLSRVLEVTNEVHSCDLLEKHESQWNNFVHSPLLKLVFPTRNPGLTLEEPHDVGVQCETVMFASIAGPWIPTFGKKRDGSVLNLACSVSADTVEDSAGNPVSTENLSLAEVHSRVASKKVDYVLALDLPDDDPLKDRVTLLAEIPAPADNSLIYVNQTIYRPLFENLIAVSIETKANSESKTDSFVQLCIWVAAWHNRMENLRMQLFRRQENLPSSFTSAAQTEGFGLPSGRLVSVPMIEVIGHDWMLHFACDEGNSIRIYGPFKIGSTESVLEVYKLLSSLEAIRDWIKGTFRERMGEWFGVDNSHLPRRDEGSNRL